jgi:hypothetical protein
MTKKSKVKTPDWILEGYDSPAEYAKAKGGGEKIKWGEQENEEIEKKNSKGGQKKAKIYKLKVCPDCDSEEVGIVLTGQEGKAPDEWVCRKCKWKGHEIKNIELSEDEFLERIEVEEEEEDESDDEMVEIDITEINLTALEIDELIGKLNELKQNKSQVEFELDEDNDLVINYDDEGEE